MKTKQAPFRIYIWYIIYPLCIYHIVLISVMFFAGLVLGTDTEAYMKCQILGTLATIPVMYMSFYKQNANVIQVWGRQEKLLDYKRKNHREKDTNKDKSRVKEAKKHLLKRGECSKWIEKFGVCFLIIAIAACIGIGYGNLLTMSPLARMSKGFEEANEHFYGSTLTIEILGAGILTPLLEELLYRGIIYERLRFFMEKKVVAVLLAALIFAMVHVNLVQFVYAFGMGIVLALCMELTEHVCGAILAHMVSNVLAVIRTECGLWQHLGDGSVFAWMSSCGLLLIGVLLLVWVLQREVL